VGPRFESWRAHSESPRKWGFSVSRAGDIEGRVATERATRGVLEPIDRLPRYAGNFVHPPSHSISTPLAVIVTLRSRAAARAHSVARVGFGRLPASIRVRAAAQRKRARSPRDTRWRGFELAERRWPFRSATPTTAACGRSHCLTYATDPVLKSQADVWYVSGTKHDFGTFRDRLGSRLNVIGSRFGPCLDELRLRISEQN
jgi:hypothetical protein